MDIFGLALMNLHLQFVLFVFKTPTNVSCPPVLRHSNHIDPFGTHKKYTKYCLRKIYE